MKESVGFTDVRRSSGKNVKRRVTGRNSTPRSAQVDPDVWQLLGAGSRGRGGAGRGKDRGESGHKLPKVSLLVAKRRVNTAAQWPSPPVTYVSWA